MDSEIAALVQNAWYSLIRGRKVDPVTGFTHWTDNEADTGFLKNVDALNALIEPYLLCPESFKLPPLSATTLIELAKETLALRSASEADDYNGFSADPYPYVQVPVDYIDSASDSLRLVCNLCNLSPTSVSEDMISLAQSTARSAISVLVESCIVDQLGSRWGGIAANRSARFANLFFTNKATLALHRARCTPLLKQWIATSQWESVDRLLDGSAYWAAHQYDEKADLVWSDEARTLAAAASALCALEILYTIAKEEYFGVSAQIVKSVSIKMKDLVSASSLQRDFFHSFPLPGYTGAVFYDDRRYLGGFLGIFAEAIQKTPSVRTKDFDRACEVLLEGVGREWLDDPTGLWDNGRPLICYSLDALVGLVTYASLTKVRSPSHSARRLRIFLCHSNGDKSVARDLYRNLRNEGWDPWLDEENLLPGQDWEHEILKAVRDSDVVIVCISTKSINKIGFLQREIKYALDAADERPEGAIFIIPFRIDDCDVPRRLLRWQWVNAFDSNGYLKLLQALQFRARELGLQ